MADLAPSLHALWGQRVELALCERCDGRFLRSDRAASSQCPHCHHAPLAPLTAPPGDDATTHPPEFVVPFSAPPEAVAEQCRQFARSIPFAPPDLRPDILAERLRRLYLPLWLVDSRVTATWQGEVGFDYQVISHQERFAEGKGWATQEVTETRIRWEPRAGRLQRPYENIPGPALEAEGALAPFLNSYPLESRTPYRAESLDGAQVYLPRRSTTDAWPDTLPALRAAAADECQRAARANHIRDFAWTPQYEGIRWTLCLLPLYSSYYLDDAGQPQRVLLHGQSAQLRGARRASMRRAKRWTQGLLAVAFVLAMFGLAMLLLLSSLQIVAVAALMAAAFVGLAALYPVARVWQFNAQAERARAEASPSRHAGG